MCDALMRKILEFRALTASRHRIPLRVVSIFLLVILASNAGCSVKRTVKVRVSPNILQAKSAAFDELLDIVRSYDKIEGLSSNDLRITLTSGKRESGELQKYASAPGYIVLRRPDSTRMVVQYPVTKTTILDLLSVGDDFCVWVPRENKYYTGKNSAKELVAEDLPDSPGFTLRATHIFEAIIPHGLLPGAPGMLVEAEEDPGADAAYYVLSVFKEDAGVTEGAARRIHAIRKIWIERSGLTIARQRVYQEEGRVVSDITYSEVTQVGGFALPLKIRIDRPLDGYTLDMEFRTWRVNPDLPDSAFILPPPAGAQVVPFKEKGRSAVS
jgi:hypothetical protein